MKKLLLLAVTGMFLISCGGGWSDDDVKAFNDYCPMNKELCNCFLNAAQDRYFSFEEFEKSGDDMTEEVEEWMYGVEEDCMGS